ncbi:regulator of g protein signaling [Anaeramoeba flamelloides]|uniref:Regulator of g protein signaling n=1 Tax=Anaeramoeba flamelloides TaxID=1746091 RepID=A0ABQ8X5X5_9EUKA|nr:regulator of g protein signaling [Anaeramoeba flamelloides]
MSNSPIQSFSNSDPLTKLNLLKNDVVRWRQVCERIKARYKKDEELLNEKLQKLQNERTQLRNALKKLCYQRDELTEKIKQHDQFQLNSSTVSNLKSYNVLKTSYEQAKLLSNEVEFLLQNEQTDKDQLIEQLHLLLSNKVGEEFQFLEEKDQEQRKEKEKEHEMMVLTKESDLLQKIEELTKLEEREDELKQKVLVKQEEARKLIQMKHTLDSHQQRVEELRRTHTQNLLLQQQKTLENMGRIEWLKVEKNDLKFEIQRLSKEREAKQSIEEDNFVIEKRIFAVKQRLAFEQRRQIALTGNMEKLRKRCQELINEAQELNNEIYEKSLDLQQKTGEIKLSGQDDDDDWERFKQDEQKEKLKWIQRMKNEEKAFQQIDKLTQSAITIYKLNRVEMEKRRAIAVMSRLLAMLSKKLEWKDLQREELIRQIREEAGKKDLILKEIVEKKKIMEKNEEELGEQKDENEDTIAGLEQQLLDFRTNEARLRKEAKETRWKLEEQIFAEKQKVKDLTVEYEKLKKEKEEEREKEKQNASDIGVKIETLRTALGKHLSNILKKEIKKDQPVQDFQNNYKEIQEVYMRKEEEVQKVKHNLKVQTTYASMMYDRYNKMSVPIRKSDNKRGWGFRRGNKKKQQSEIPNIPLTVLLKQKEFRKFFLDFLVSKFSQENLLFWVEVEKYTKLKENELLSHAKQIFQEYIAKDSPYHISIDQNIANQCQQEIQSSNTSRNCFKAARESVEYLMSIGAYPKFLKSPEYKKLLKLNPKGDWSKYEN